MQKFENRLVETGECAARLGPKEQVNSIHYSQNVFLEDLEFVKCEFRGPGLATYGAPISRSTARNVRLQDCATNSFYGTGAVFDDVVVDGLRTSRSPVILNGCAFRHVVLKGKCGHFLFNRRVCHDNEERNAAFESANAAFYANLDWALDIADLNAVGIEIRGAIPSRLIRRNPDEHFIMTRSIALSDDWKAYEPFTSFQVTVSLFLDSDADDDLFVLCRRSKDFKQRLEFFHRLRSAGLVT